MKQHNQIKTIVYVKRFKIKNIEPGAVTFTTAILEEFEALLKPISRSPSPTEERAEELEIENNKLNKPRANLKKWGKPNFPRSRNSIQHQSSSNTAEYTQNQQAANIVPRANLKKWGKPNFPKRDKDRTETNQ